LVSIYIYIYIYRKMSNSANNLRLMKWFLVTDLAMYEWVMIELLKRKTYINSVRTAKAAVYVIFSSIFDKKYSKV
jgi:uncharacterized membrane-anchored protein